VDYKKLAEELGGRAEPQSGTETPAIDYKALAEQYGGVQKEEEQPLAATPGQPRCGRTIYFSWYSSKKYIGSG
jgi:hypothetical protein